jgi:hypothetical protein
MKLIQAKRRHALNTGPIQKNIDIDGVELTATFEYTPFEPATRWEPGTCESVDILKIGVVGSNVDIIEILSDAMIDRIENEIFAVLEKEKEDNIIFAKAMP